MIGVIGVGVSIYTYYKTQRIVEAVFLVEPSRSEILTADKIGDAPIRVLKANGEQITNDLTSIKFYFWNNGTESIKQRNILKPISLSFSTNEVEILDFKIIKLSRDITGAKLTRNVPNSLIGLDIDFVIMEPNDGFAGQIIFSGPKDAVLTITGIIEGSSGIATNAEMANQRFWSVSSRLFAILIVFIFVTALNYKIFSVVNFYRKQPFSSAAKTNIEFFATIITGTLVAILFFWTFGTDIFFETREDAENSIASVAPVSILPNK